MKLSKAQEEVLKNAKAKIDIARELDYPEWLRVTEHYYQIPDWADEKLRKQIDERLEKAVNEHYLYKYYQDAKNAIVLTHCNSKTLRKLETFDLIEIIYDSAGDGGFGIDTVKVLNY